MKYESAKEIYSTMNSVWPDNSRWYNHTRQCIIDFIIQNLSNKLSLQSLYLNAGSGGSEYNIPGICHHVDVAENLVNRFDRYTVASIENLPFASMTFDAIICVGSVINYCDVVKSLSELTRTLKPGGYLVLELERSNTGELLLTQDYGKTATRQRYKYLGHTHTLWLYSEQLVKNLLIENEIKILKQKRFHCASALINRLTGNEEFSGRFSVLDPLLSPLSYWVAHNTILLCQKQSF